MKDMLGRLVKKIVDLPEEILGVLYDLVDKLSGLSWQEWLTELKKFLRKEQCWVRKAATWKTWNTIRLGTHRNVETLKADLKKAGRQINSCANYILNKISLNDVEHEVKLTLVSVEELGFKDGATLEEIFGRALELGLSLCPAEVGPQLVALRCLDQPLPGKAIRIAMEPIADSVGILRLFSVVSDDDGLWLCAGYGLPDRFWDPVFRFVFVRRK